MEIAPTPATPAARQSATLFVALELSRAKWLVGLHSPVADKISRRTVTGGDAAALLAVIDEPRRRVRAQLGEEVAVAACYEAGYDGFCCRTASPATSSIRPACWSTAAPADATPMASTQPACCAR